jgi:hypothetical protein
MNFDIASVRLDRIDQADETYRISTNSSDPQLDASIKAIGFINPPVLMPLKTTAYRIVSGFKRIAAGERLGWTGIDSRILAPETEELWVLGAAIADNAQHRDLNPVEQALAVEKLSRCVNHDADLIDFGNKLGLSLNQKLVARLRLLRRLSDAIQARIISSAIPLTIALELEKLPQSSAEALADLFDTLRPTLNQQKEMLMWVQDIAGAEDRSIPEILEAATIPDILADTYTERPQKLKKVREALKRRRYPTICRFETVLEKNRKALNLPSDICLSAPENFEDNRFAMTISFRSLSEFKEHIDTLTRIADNPNFTAIVNKQIGNQEALY